MYMNLGNNCDASVWSRGNRSLHCGWHWRWHIARTKSAEIAKRRWIHALIVS